jgi:NAD(P)-dependent dehydrogenase (short-subunit alcohol dehydrogenase family)
MLTLDLAEELRERGVTANSLHPGTFMSTKMVLETGVEPVDSLETGVESALRLVIGHSLEGVTGRDYDQIREARALPSLTTPRRGAALVGLAPQPA